MPSERRKQPRVARWFDGTWQGASGASKACRVSDVSTVGCFVHTLASPSAGERTTITIVFGLAEPMTFVSEVAYIEQTIGFGAKFIDLSAEDEAQLECLLASFKKASA